jgi:ribosomal protein S18 acetylase RimI-like enzyme
MKIEYLEKDETGLDILQPLWEKLKEHHRVRSLHFKEQFDELTWEKRKRELLNKAYNSVMLVHLAKDSDTSRPIGYCVSTISEDKTGEIESIFIEAEYRRSGIGANFMKRAL